ncbi:MAG: hypothetical protein JW768_15715, partial [Chitinispirillaceae bacterium]|nr:hypothetical protein [Chitinispirillaceae bacterium]
PPPSVIFIFATTEPHKIPATIHSRCQRYDFRRIVPEQILARLEKICVEEKIAFEKEALVLIARKADGSMRDALSLLDQAYAYCPELLAEKEVRLVLGLVSMEVYARVMDAIAGHNPGAALEVIQEVLYQGYDLHEFVTGLQEHLRLLLFSRIDKALESAGMGVESGMAEKLRASSQRFSEGDLLRMMEIARRSENEIKWSALPRIAVENMLLKLVYLDSTVSIEQVLAALGTDDGNAPKSAPQQSLRLPELKKNPDAALNAQRRSSPCRVEEPAPALEEPYPASGVPSCDSPEIAERFDDCSAQTPQDVRERWPAFIESFMRDRPNIGTFLSLATIAGSSDSSIDLVYQDRFKFQFSEITRKQNRDEITRLLETFMGRPIDVHITLETKKTDKKAPKYFTQAAHAASIDNEIRQEPIISSVLELFDGEILT